MSRDAMSRHHILIGAAMRTHHHLLVAAAVLCVALPLPRAAEGQLGGLIKKKVAEKVAERAGVDKADGTPSNAARYTEATIGAALDARTLDATLRGTSAMMQRLGELDALRREVTALVNAGPAGAAGRQYEETRARVLACRAEHLDRLDRERMEALEREMRRPSVPSARIDRFENAQIALQQAVLALQMKGDTAGVRRSYREFFRAEGGPRVDPAADSAAAARACEAMPDVPDGLRRAARADSLREHVRALEATVVGAGVEASGLPAHQFNLARERLLTFRLDAASGVTRPWSREEYDLLESRREEIDAHYRVLAPVPL